MTAVEPPMNGSLRDTLLISLLSQYISAPWTAERALGQSLDRQVLEQKIASRFLAQKSKLFETSFVCSTAKTLLNPVGITISEPSGLHFGTISSEPLSKSITFSNGSLGTVIFHRAITIPCTEEYEITINAKSVMPFRVAPNESFNIDVTAKPSRRSGMLESFLVIILCHDVANSPIPDKPNVFKCLVTSRHLTMTVMSPLNFKFDVYAPPFIPDAWKAINELPARLIQGGFVPQTDFIAYKASWMVQPSTSSFRLSNIVPISEDSCSIPILSPSTYVNTFQILLQVELGAITLRMKGFCLFDAQIISEDTGLFSIEVPGMVEGSPSIGVGDLIRVRKLNFDGREYEGYVQASLRRTRRIHVAMPLLTVSPGDSFNVLFVVNQLPFMHMMNGLFHLGDLLGLNGTLVTPLRKILFPDPEHGSCFMNGQSQLPSTDLNFYDKGLNWAQMKAVQTIVDQKHGDVPFLIWGPPGTGKTKTCIESILQILLRYPEARVLACAPSNSAADTLTSRLIPHMTVKKLLRLNPSSRPFAEIPQHILPYTYSTMDSVSGAGYFDFPPIHFFLQFRVVVTTCLDAGMILSSGLSNQDCSEQYNVYHKNMIQSLPFFHRKMPSMSHFWTHLLIDEAGQASEPETAVPLSVIATSVSYHDQELCLPRLILSGDHMQLGPLVYSEFSRNHGLGVSLFERIIQRPLYYDHPESRKAPSTKSLPKETVERSNVLNNCIAPFVNLTRNYRSHPALLMVPSHIWYNETLIPFAEKSESHSFLGIEMLPNPYVPIVFYGIEGVDDRTADGNSTWWNKLEALKVIEVVDELVKKYQVGMKDIGIMAPFREQVKTIRAVLRQKKYSSVDVGTVEDYQGAERKITILSCVRSRMRFVYDDIRNNLGMISCPARLNVAMTRAKALQIVIGNPKCLQMDPLWVSFLSFYARNECYEGCTLPLAVLKASKADSLSISKEGELSLPGRLEKAREWGKLLMNTPEDRCLGQLAINAGLEGENLSLKWSQDIIDMMTELENPDEEFEEDMEDDNDNNNEEEEEAEQDNPL